MSATNLRMVCGLAIAAIGIGSTAAQQALGGAQATASGNGIKYRLAGKLPASGALTMYVRSKETRSGKIVPKYVDAVSVSNLLVKCDEGYEPVAFSSKDDADINRSGEFSYVIDSPTAELEGTVTKGGRNSAGTLSFGPTTVVSDIDGATLTNCSLEGGPIPYKARNV